MNTNEIIVSGLINGISLKESKVLLDENGKEMKFRSRLHAETYLKEHGATEEDIYFMQFIYTNESRKCDCFICEKRNDCNMYMKFQRLPRDANGCGGLGLCPKL